MGERLQFWLVFAAALGSGLMAGLFFVFSNTVMAALGRIPASAGIAAMQQINVAIQNPLFFVGFFGPALLSAILIAACALGWAVGGTSWIVAGSVLYLAGIIGVTIAFNVPMNEALAAADPSAADGAELWADYLKRWTMWNHVRSIAGFGALAAFMLALKG